MAAIAEPHAETATQTETGPMQAIANFVKGNVDLTQKLSATESIATPPPPEPKPKPEPSPAPKPKEEVKSGKEEFDYENPNPDKPPHKKENWAGFIKARQEERKRLSEEAAKAKAEAESLRKQIAENQAKSAELPANDPEKESLRQEKEELSRQLYAVSRERHPDFIAKYDGEIGRKTAAIRKISGAELGDKIVKLVTLPDSEWKREQIKESLGEVDELDRPLIRSLWHEIEMTQEARQNELNVSKEDFNRMVAEHTNKTKAQQEAALKSQVENVHKLFGQRLSLLRNSLRELSERDGDVEWNAKLNSDLDDVKSLLLGKGDPTRVVEVMLQSVAFPRTKVERDSLELENKKLKDQIESLTKSSGALAQGQPGKRKDAPGSSPQTATTPLAGMRPSQAINEWVKNLTNPEQ